VVRISDIIGCIAAFNAFVNAGPGIPLMLYGQMLNVPQLQTELLQ